jgi:hypothetical protein
LLNHHYGILQALVILARVSKVRDPGCIESLDIVENKRSADGCWHAETFLLEADQSACSNVDVVD